MCLALFVLLLALPVAADETNCPLPRTALGGGGPDPDFLAQYGSTYRFRMGQPLTRSLRITPDGGKVLFLRSGGRNFENRLYEIDVAGGSERELLTADALLGGGNQTMTAEERARRERMRMVSRGITSFELGPDGETLLVPLSGRVFLVARRNGEFRELKLPTPAEDPRLSPDGKKVAFVHRGDLYVITVGSGEVRRLTDDADAATTNGLAEFVAQEEMSRYRGFWWSPDSRELVYQKTRTTGMETLNISDPTHPEKAPDVRPYPRAGKANAQVQLGIVPATGGATRWIEWDRNAYPYLATVTWTEDAPLTLLVQNRRQTEELLLAVHGPSAKARVIHAETDDAWVDLDQSMPRWFARGSGFLWTTEREGYRQFEIRNRNGMLRHSITPLHPGYRQLHHLDETRGLVYVSASPDPTQAHLHRFSIRTDGPEPVRLTRGSGVHSAYFGASDEVFVQQSRTMQGTRFTIRHVDGEELAEIASKAEVPSFAGEMERTTRFSRVGPRERSMPVVTIVPRSYDPKKTYPVIVHVYGGPTSVMVQQYRSRYYLDQWIADHGYVVVSIDGRGTPNRNRAWQRAVKHDLIELPLQDQADAVVELGKRCANLDMQRVGIYGWSFGGYFSAMAAMRRPDVFHAGVAGAPVTDWADYDTHYTERYMGLPQENVAGYRAANVLTYAEQLERPLLIIHGTSDDNVLFTHALKMANALFRSGKPFEFLPLSGFTHIVPDPLVSRRLYGRMLGFFETHVKGRAVGEIEKQGS
ncbi:hypothetical protein ABI59_05135 [Acidobacteria bacterium Mor1]|nr:hypothetical protein ABI59_05135 [Acidobacteria bacterium Mor1]